VITGVTDKATLLFALWCN